MQKITNSLFLWDLLVVGFLREDRFCHCLHEWTNRYKKDNNKILLKTAGSIAAKFPLASLFFTQREISLLVFCCNLHLSVIHSASLF